MSHFFFSIFIFALTVGVLIGFHEFGHFIVARCVGIKVLRFSIGFGKPLIKWHDKKGTEFVIALIPLGGYVRMLDEREAPVAINEQHLAFNRQSILKRLAVIFAGCAFNILLAIIIYWAAFTHGVMQIIPRIGVITANSIAEKAGMQTGEIITHIDNYPVSGWPAISLRIIQRLGSHGEINVATQDKNNQIKQYQLFLTHWTINNLNPAPTESLGIIPLKPPEPIKFSQIFKDSPAAKAGLLNNDQIIAINNKPVKSWNDFVNYVKHSPGQTVNFTVLRDQQTLKIPVTFGSSKNWYGKLQGTLGVEESPIIWPPDSLRMRQYPFWQSWITAFKEVGFFVQYNFVVLKKLVTGVISLQSLGGPLSLFKGSLIAANQGVIAYSIFLAFISITLAIVNLLPVPGLDGSQIVYLLIEAVTRKPVSLALQVLLFRLGVIALSLLFIQALMNDITRLIAQ